MQIGHWLTAAIVTTLMAVGVACTGSGGGDGGSTSRCTDEQALARVRPSLVRIETDGDFNGTGLILDSGLVLTNAHVVDEARRVKVVTDEGSSDATVTSLDRDADLTLLSTDTRGLPPIDWADTDQLVAGQRLIAVGFAFGFEGDPTVASGIFSDVRDIDGVPHVQSDARLSEGMSGGPLVNTCGEVAGVNTFTLDYHAFSIDANYLSRAVTDLVRSPRIDPAPTEEPYDAVYVLDESENGCGTDADVQPVDTPIGRTYRDGDELSITLEYVAGTCTRALANFDGYFLEGSPWFDFWCEQPDAPVQCGPDRISATFVFNDGAPLIDDSGTITLAAEPGSFPPRNRGSAPNLEGFHLCAVRVTLHDDAFGGEFVTFEVTGDC